MGNSKNKTTQTASTSFPDYINQAQQNIVQSAQGIAQPIVEGSQSGVADWTWQQQRPVDLANYLADETFVNDARRQGQMIQAGQGYDAATGEAAQLTGDEIKGMMNPYLDTVGRQTLADMRREKTASDAQIGARSASGVAFGGSGAALERAQLERGYGKNVGEAISGIMSGGFDRAAGLAGQNVNARNQMMAANLGAENTARQFSAGQGLDALIAADTADTASNNRRIAALQQLMGATGTEYAYRQAQLDDPKNYLSWFSQFVPGVTGTTTSTTKTPTNALSTILGVAQLGGRAMGMGA